MPLSYPTSIWRVRPWRASWTNGSRIRSAGACEWGLEGHPDPDVLKRPSIAKGLRQVAERGLIFEFLLQTPQLEGALALCEQMPELKTVIEHLAKPDFRDPEDREVWRRLISAFAERTNVAGKLSMSPRVEQIGDLLANPNSGWDVGIIEPYVDFLLDTFGPDRLFWGSDWPVSACSHPTTQLHGVLWTTFSGTSERRHTPSFSRLTPPRSISWNRDDVQRSK